MECSFQVVSTMGLYKFKSNIAPDDVITFSKIRDFLNFFKKVTFVCVLYFPRGFV